jgi:hypothetical protein
MCIHVILYEKNNLFKIAGVLMIILLNLSVKVHEKMKHIIASLLLLVCLLPCNLVAQEVESQAD